MSLDLSTLIAKLNDPCRRAAERAASLCVGRGHPEVDVEHLLLALLERPASDLAVLCQRAAVPVRALQADLEAELRRFKGGYPRTPVFAEQVQPWLTQAWLLASLSPAPARIRSAHLLVALLTHPGLRQVALRASACLARLDPEAIGAHLDELTQGSEEASPAAPTVGLALGGAGALAQFTTNLTERARAGQLDPVIGREPEIRQAMDILMRRRQNNPILTGEAGVGKTAVVEGLAYRVAQGEVPPALQGVAIHVLDMGLLQAGASVKGEFERRLQGVIDEVRQSLHPIILFIDEAHTLIGAGGQAGQNDAANLLKPALARGELRTVAATTWGEYKKYFEKDAALARRFQVVKVEEPTEPMACAMLRGMAPLMEAHFGVRLLEEAIAEAVRLSARYISDRQLPDKAVAVLDTACARVALGQSATPARIEDARQALRALADEAAALEREARTGAAHALRLADMATQREALTQALRDDEDRWGQEQQAVQAILALRQQLEHRPDARTGTRSGADLAAETELQQALARLTTLQDRSPLVPLQVDAAVVAEIVSGWTGIPLGKMVTDELQAVRNLQASLQARVIGQDHALAAIAQRVRTGRAGLDDPCKPQGVFFFAGPSGVGKTETALALADTLYGGERQLITINMSEYQEAHSVSVLKGAPPGYVGHGEGGLLTEAVRRKPYSVVLLDEVEKAHPDVLELFFQVFDKGVMDDAEGREVNFRNTLIILTSNAGSAQVMQHCMAHDAALGGLVMKPASLRPGADALTEALRPVLYKLFKPAFVGRTLVVPFYPLSDEVLARVIRLKLERIAARVQAQHQAVLDYDEALVETVLARCAEVDTGARAVDHILQNSLLPALADQVLAHLADGRALRRIEVRCTADGDLALSTH